MLPDEVRVGADRLLERAEYDALGRRVKKIADPGATSSPAETRYFYDSLNLVEEQSDAGAVANEGKIGERVFAVMGLVAGFDKAAPAVPDLAF